MTEELEPQELDVDELTRTFAPACRVAVLSMHTSPLEQPGAGDAGGLNVYVRQVAEAMTARRVYTDVYTRRTSPDEPDVREVLPGVRVFSIDAGPPRPVHKDRLRRLVRRFVDGVEARATLDGPYDLVHAHYWLSAIAGAELKQRWGVPLLVSFHSLERSKGESEAIPAAASRIRGERRVVRAADRLIAGSEAERDHLVELYGADPERVAVVPLGVDHEVFHPRGREAARKRFGFGDAPTVVFVGRLQPLKGPDVAVSALGRLSRIVPDAQLVIAGGDSPRGHTGETMRLVLAARRLGVVRRVTFLDPLPHRDLADLYRAADAVVIPSASETFGLVALEAAACGAPVVATAVGGLRRLVRDGQTGYLVPRRDPAAFAAALSRVITDPAARDRLGANAVELARSYPWSRTADGVLRAYAAVMACPSERGELSGVN